MELRLRRGDRRDTGILLGMFDGAVAWLAARGSAGQWGDRPWSQRPESVALVEELAGEDGLWIAECGGRPAGALIVSQRAPEPVPPVAAGQSYVLLLLTAREFAGRAIGAELLRHAGGLAWRQGKSVLRVDCWAGGDGKLVEYYRRAGFTPTGTFDRGGWPGQVLERPVTGPGDAVDGRARDA